MTRREKQLAKAARDGDAKLIEARLALHRARELACAAQDYEAEVAINCGIQAISGVTIYAIKTLRVEVDESI